MTGQSGRTAHRYGIGAVAQRTGLTDHTIRAWERRYGAVVARRAPNGRRVYGPDDVEKLALLKQLTERGESIGQIAAAGIDELRERARELDESASPTLPERIGVAILGDFLPAQVAGHERDLAPLDVAVADANRERFLADLARQTVDVIVLESPVLDDDVLRQLNDYIERAGAACGVLAYQFGRARDVSRAADARIVALRSPINVDEARAAVIRAFTVSAPARRDREDGGAKPAAEWDDDGPVAPRRFSNLQLATLLRASTAIDCECPHHLAQLVGDLTAFEVYSANCANRDEDDAALHRYLHRTTARARAMVEAALERVATAEGIEY